MQIGKNIKKIREAKGLQQKEVALSSKVDSGNYSRIENDKSDPTLSTLVKIAKALGVPVAELFTADESFADLNSIDKSLMEKIALIEGLDKKEKAAFFIVLDAFVTKNKLKESLSKALKQAQ